MATATALPQAAADAAGPNPLLARALDMLRGLGFREGQLYSCSQIGRRLPAKSGGDQGLNPSTVTRWITDGLPRPGGQGGEVVRLSSLKVGGTWAVSILDLAEFFAAATPDHARPEAPAPRSPAERSKASAKAKQELKRRGV